MFCKKHQRTAFEEPFAKVWVNVCDSLQKLGTLVSGASASPEVEKEAAINLLTDGEKWSV